MKIEQTLLSEMTDGEAADLRAFCVSVIHGGIVPTGAMRVMQAWIDEHGREMPKPVGAFTQVALYSLLVRAEGLATPPACQAAPSGALPTA